MKSIIITVDTEGHVGIDPVKHLIWGETSDGQQNGIPLIMDLCDEVGAKALFFVDIAEAWHYGEEKIAEVMRYIVSRGHQVGVHIHPDHMADPKRLFLYEYSYNEQYDIIDKCSKFYESVLKQKPEAFRAGKYGANRDTLQILDELNYKADFSEFYGQKWCGINPPITGNQTVKVTGSLIEVPVMSYKSEFYNLIKRYDKFDINATYTEQKYILNRLLTDDNIDPIVVFAHSFSLLNWRAHPNSPVLDKKAVAQFKRILELLKDTATFSSLDKISSIPYAKNETATVFTIDKFHSALFFCLKAKSVLTQRMQIQIRNMRDKSSL